MSITVFNKQFRDGEKLISELRKKIRKSKSITMDSGEKNSENFHLDTVDLVFNLDMKNKTFGVYDKSGKEIYFMDCTYDSFDEWAKIRSNWYSVLLNYARNQLAKKTKKAEKLKEAANKVNASAKAKEAKKATKEVQEKAISDALEKLRGL